MDRRHVITFLAAVALAVPVSGREARAASRAAPEVVFHRADGEQVRVSDFKGKVLLVDFWASWCVPCKASFPALDAIYREYQPRGVEVLAVNLDEDRRHADGFLAAHPHRMPVMFDPKGVTPEAFGVKGMPTSYVIDRAGSIRFIHVGYSGNVNASYRQEITQLLAEPS
jgi:thiol-disulfide isomerase/thioredoxin